MSRAKALFQSGRYPEAAAVCRAVLKGGQSVAECLVLLGSIATITGAAKTAIPLLQLALSLEPDDISALNALGLAHRTSKNFAEAAACFEQVLLRNPARLEPLRNLAHTYFEQKSWAKACEAFEKLFATGQQAAKDWVPYAMALHHSQRNADAVPLMETFTGMEPANAEAWFVLGMVCYEFRGARAAIDAFRTCLRYNPKKMQAYLSLSALYHRHSNAEVAAAVCREALKADPNFLNTYMNYGLALASMGKGREAVEAFRRVLLGHPGNSRCRSNLLFYSQYLDDVSPKQLYDLHHEWQVRHGEPLRRSWPKHPNDRTAGRRLRIGYVSPDLKFHSCSWFLSNLLENHDHSAFEIHAYSNADRPDAMTERFKTLVDVWHDVSAINETALARKIYQDRIDILVDLAGHTARNSLIAFACKPAPVQVTWLGYPGTTGLSAIDYRLSDAWLTPEGGPELFSEQVYNLPGISHCFSPPEDAPEVAPLPALANGYVTFGSFNNFAKISDETARLWTSALNRVPNARLLLKSRYIEGQETKETLLDRFRRAGADLSRILFVRGTERQDEHLSEYRQIDIALDTSPYGGMTTTCEALWMGVPVVTLSGDRTSARYGTSVVSAVGMGDLAAGSPEAFAETAGRLASDIGSLAEVRKALRGRMAASSLCDGKGFAQAVEAAYRTMWERWCRSQTA
ncbi:MAG TPA: tetratricopeptide repeat protein [Azospirillum sp.]|nr:tetratricopeptide repeat protein [Azospirillum sp.]